MDGDWGGRWEPNSLWIPVWQPRRAADMSMNWRQSLFCCCTASMKWAADGAKTTAIDRLVSSWSENISVSFCLQASGYGLTLWCAFGLVVGGRNTSASVTVTVTLTHQAWQLHSTWLKNITRWPDLLCHGTNKYSSVTIFLEVAGSYDAVKS